MTIQQCIVQWCFSFSGKKEHRKDCKKPQSGASLFTHVAGENRLYANEEKFRVVRNVKPCKWYKLYDPEKHRA